MQNWNLLWEDSSLVCSQSPIHFIDVGINIVYIGDRERRPATDTRRMTLINLHAKPMLSQLD